MGNVSFLSTFQVNSDLYICLRSESSINSLTLSAILPDKPRQQHNTDTHKILMTCIILIWVKKKKKKKVVVTKSDSRRESYIQNGDAASRRPVRFFTHNSGSHPELRFRCKISTATTTAVLYSSERSYRGSSRTKHRVGLAVKLSFLWVGEEGRASPDSGGLLALQTSPLRLMYL